MQVEADEMDPELFVLLERVDRVGGLDHRTVGQKFVASKGGSRSPCGRPCEGGDVASHIRAVLLELPAVHANVVDRRLETVPAVTELAARRSAGFEWPPTHNGTDPFTGRHVVTMSSKDTCLPWYERG